MKKLNSEIYKIDEIYNFRDLVNHSASKYSNNVAYKFKKNLGKPNQKIVEKTYSQIKEEVVHFFFYSIIIIVYNIYIIN